jgi:hypothetical protein
MYFGGFLMFKTDPIFAPLRANWSLYVVLICLVKQRLLVSMRAASRVIILMVKSV